MNNTVQKNKKFEEIMKTLLQATETEIHNCLDKAKFVWITTKNIIRSIVIKTFKEENIKKRKKIKILENKSTGPRTYSRKY